MRFLVPALLAVVLVACGEVADNADSTPPEPDATTSTTSTTLPTEETSTMPDIEPPKDIPAVDAAVSALASRLGVESTAIDVVKVQDFTWNDGSLGCPEEGRGYTQALVDGYQIVLGHDGRIFDYRSGESGEARLCPSPEKDGGYDFVPSPRFDD